MLYHRISDWDNAYANVPNIPGGDRWPALWTDLSGPFRERMMTAGRAKLDIPYGPGPRNGLDLFLPEGRARGLAIYIHGGYWRAFDKTVWSHLAQGPMAHGFAVAMPGYTLCPDIRVSGITAEIGAAITHAAGLIEGPIHLTGHSAGGHLATRMVCMDTPLPAGIIRRIANTVSISGVHDLRPLLRIQLNEILHLDAAEAAAESPALLAPLPGARLACWVGGGERAEFIRQSELLANVWTGLGAETMLVEEPDRHHFTVVDGLADPGHALTRSLLDL